MGSWDRSVEGAARRRRKVAQYAIYVDLVAGGASVVEAARSAGVSRRTGFRWQRGGPAESGPRRGRRPGWARRAGPVSSQDTGSSRGLAPVLGRGRFLSLDERLVIADEYLAGSGVRQIAAMLGRAPSTVSRELARNVWVRAGTRGRARSDRRYGPYGADRAARARRRRPKTRTLLADPVLHAHVQARLAQRWSPRQIAKTLPRVFPEQPERHIVHETIYQALYVQARGGLRREVAAALRTGRARRRPRRDLQTRRSRFTEPMVMISERPAEAADRAVPGHWEGDLIIGRDGGSAIVTLVERHTRYLLLIGLPAGRDAVSVRDRLIDAAHTLPAHLWRSLTWDQGSEMARHHEFRLATGIPVYFCDPASPWLRGSNENTNGLLRQYFPKGTDLSLHDDAHLAHVAAELNGRPRETLDWDTPAERLATLLTANKQRCCNDH